MENDVALLYNYNSDNLSFNFTEILFFILHILNGHPSGTLLFILSLKALRNQRCSESTSSVAFEVLIINCRIEFMNLFIFNCLALNINLFILNCLTSNFCFPKNIYFASRKEQLFMNARQSLVPAERFREDRSVQRGPYLDRMKRL